MNDSLSAPDFDDEFEPDPIFIDSLREAGWILLMWGCCFIWTLAICLTYGYQEQIDPRTFKTVYGIPAWVAYGIVLPWLVANVVTIWFCAFKMKDGHLGEDDPEVDDLSAAPGEEGAGQ